MEELKDTLYDPENGLTYKREGDYYIPDLKLPKPAQIGIWGMRRHDYLKNHRRVIYYAMQMKETLNPYLEEVDRAANEMHDRLIKQFATAEGITEDLKATNQMEGVARMNNIRDRVWVIVFNELIYA